MTDPTFITNLLTALGTLVVALGGVYAVVSNARTQMLKQLATDRAELAAQLAAKAVVDADVAKKAEAAAAHITHLTNSSMTKLEQKVDAQETLIRELLLRQTNGEKHIVEEVKANGPHAEGPQEVVVVNPADSPVPVDQTAIAEAVDKKAKETASEAEE